MILLNQKLANLVKNTSKRRYFNEQYAKVRIPRRGSFELGEFIGAFAGDGNYFFDRKKGSHIIRIFLHRYDDKEYAIKLMKLIDNLFHKKVSHFEKEKLLTIRFQSKKIIDVIKEILYFGDNKTLNVSLKGDLKDYPKELLNGFTRGLFDTDGFVSSYGNITLGLVSKSAIQQVATILECEGIQCTTRERKVCEKRKQKNVLYFVVVSKKATDKYLKTVGFSNKRKELMALKRKKIIK